MYTSCQKLGFPNSPKAIVIGQFIKFFAWSASFFVNLKRQRLCLLYVWIFLGNVVWRRNTQGVFKSLYPMEKTTPGPQRSKSFKKVIWILFYTFIIDLLRFFHVCIYRRVMVEGPHSEEEIRLAEEYKRTTQWIFRKGQKCCVIHLSKQISTFEGHARSCRFIRPFHSYTNLMALLCIRFTKNLLQ